MTGQQLRVLVLDDNRDDRQATLDALHREFPDVQVEHITDEENFDRCLDAGDFDLVITDYHLHWTDGLAILRAIKAARQDWPVIMFTDTGSERIAVAAMRAGLDDYLTKSPDSFERLPAIVRSAVERTQQRRAVAKNTVHRSHRLDTDTQTPQAAHLESRGLSLLTEIAHIVASTLDTDSLLQRVAESIRHHLAVRAVGLFTLEREGQTLAMHGYSGPTSESPELTVPEICQLPASRGTGRFNVHTAPPQQTPDVAAAATLQSTDQTKERAEVCVPILSRERLIGVIEVESDSQFDLDERALSLLEAVADTVSLGLRNAHLREESQRRSQELTLLSRVSGGFGAGLNIDTLIEGTMDGLHELTGADRTYFITVDLDTRTWERTHTHVAPGYESPVGLTGTFNDMPVEFERLLTGKPFAVFDTTFDLRIDRTRDMYRSKGTQSVLLVPVQFGKRLHGALGFDYCRENHAWSPDEIRLHEGVAHQLELALDNLHLFEEVRLRADELAKALARLEELDRLKDEFIQNVSHELRSPLAIIQGYIEILKSGELGELTPKQRKPVSIIARRVRMLGDLVKDITLILEAEVSPPEPEPVPLDGLTQAAIEDFQLAAEHADLTLRAEIMPQLPPVRSSYTYMRRVLDNLLGNAIKFTPAGGTIDVRVRQEGELVVLEVSDTGPGIPQEQLERIFERFYQVDGSIWRRFGGMGLGLALVKEIVETYGGQVKVESQMGVGSTFTVLLPVVANSDNGNEPP